MVILLIEPHLDGHRGEYVARLVRSAVTRGHRIIFFTAIDSLRHPCWPEIGGLIPKPDQLIGHGTFGSRGKLGVFRSQFSYFLFFRRAVAAVAAKQKFDLVLVPYIDYVLPIFGILGTPFGKTPWVGITMRYSGHFPALGVSRFHDRPLTEWVKAMITRRACSMPSLHLLFTIDRSFCDLPDRISAALPKLKYLPDPADFTQSMPRHQARQELNLPEAAMVVLVYGGIGSRKGIEVLLGALASGLVSARVHLLIVGENAHSFLNHIGNSNPEFRGCIDSVVTVVDGYVSSRDESRAFAATDLVWLGYLDHDYMSGVLVLAGQARRPVVTGATGVAGYLARKYGLGEVMEKVDSRHAADCLNRLVADPALRERYGMNGSSLFSASTTANFNDTFWTLLENNVIQVAR